MSDYQYASFILNADSGISALKKLLILRKAEDSKVTLTWLSKKLHINSKSYLSEALNGKKVLKIDYLDELISNCHIQLLEAKLLKARIIAESRSLKEPQRQQAAAELKSLAKQLLATQFTLPELGNFHLAALVLVSFYLFPGHKARRRELVKLFGRSEALELDQALAQLVAVKALARQDEEYVLVEDLSMSAMAFAEGDIPREKDFLRESFKEGLNLLERKYDDKVLNCFFSSCVTVNMCIYQEKIAEFRSLMRSFITELDTENPDCVARINIQMYPVLVK